ncbi:PLP-dependent transferase [Hyphobacterium sp. SN044]|uniref:PLP-dependent transferase n=1 Tax=Hyphobacterium sp. SN044 TaxID=2912575 RepID=UPI001F001E79|nr:PLP-dependent transferase [Hyphobacterium sp. SN044]MCF8880329.1 PLP-dependent transferase [Hyphobacterium sp. SN044]
MLVPVQLTSILKYRHAALRGAYSSPWLEEAAHRRLLKANEVVQREIGRDVTICVWDALRHFETQKDLYRRHLEDLRMQHPNFAEEALHRLASTVVRPPVFDPPPPHTTGGAVDVTLLVSERDDRLGRFDDFSEYGRADYFLRHNPKSKEELAAKVYRQILAEAMIEAGFVGIEEEWWHFEYGTTYWAEKTGRTCIYNEVQTAPASTFLAEQVQAFANPQIVNMRGVAQAFGSPDARQAALQGTSKGHYYARTRHPNERALAKQLAQVVGGQDAVFAPSGLSAAIGAVASGMPMNGELIVDRNIYYETNEALRALGKSNGWRITVFDLADPSEWNLELLRTADIVFCDHPRNWYLSAPALAEIRQVIRQGKGELIVDTSVQPVQSLLDKNLADVVVCSLSKYPSAGETLGGGIFGCEPRIVRAHNWLRRLGAAMAPEAADTIRRQSASLVDRIDRVTWKAERIANWLKCLPEIDVVNVADLHHVGAPSGGQISAVFYSPEFAACLEEVVSWNSHRDDFPLKLACTFGAHFTTIEHFGARTGAADLPRRANIHQIGPGWIRIGVGHESEDLILRALENSILTVRLLKDQLCRDQCLSSGNTQRDQSRGESSAQAGKTIYDGVRMFAE